MLLSKRTDYALRALFTLAEFYGNGPIPIRELARRNDAPKRFLEHILLDLKSQGWVDSSAGKQGGYFLSKEPDKIHIGEVVRYFDGYLAPIGCVSVSNYERCTQETVCRFRRLMRDIRNYVARMMDEATLGGLLKERPLEHVEVMSMECMNGEGI